MNDRDFFVSHLWDWLAEGEDFPDHSRMQQLLEGSGELRAEWEEVSALRRCLQEDRPMVPAGFEESLKERLARAMEEPQGEDAPAQVIRPEKGFWGRGSALLLTGAAAALLFVFAGRPGMQPAEVADDAGLRPEAPAESAPATGVLATRSYASFQDTLSADSLREASRPDDLQSVSTLREGRD